MDSSMTLGAIAGMFSAMVALAIIPDASVLAVVARSIASGFKHGLVVVLGIIVGDFIFILFAVFGLSALVKTMDSLFYFIKYLGAVYLLCLGLLLWMSRPKTIELEGIEESSWLSNFLCGLFITFADPKAILFYMSFLPAFIDISMVSFIDIGIILGTAIVALCCTKLVYAFMADKSRILFKSSTANKKINIIAGSIMVVTGLVLAIQT
ncbi:MAG: LysE family translocator [Gammaproteobacteria bacterium]|jgi:threonine/homoserine/homoserine lactone efflux protein